MTDREAPDDEAPDKDAPNDRSRNEGSFREDALSEGSLSPSGRSRKRRKKRRDNGPAQLPVPAEAVSSRASVLVPAWQRVQPAPPASAADAEARAGQVPPPLPASLAVLTREGVLDERSGKRRRKREGAQSGPRECPRCHARKAAHVQPHNLLARLFDRIGIHTYSCRACRHQHMGFGLFEGPAFTWQHLGFLLIVILMLAAAFIALHPAMTHLPDLE